MVKIAVESKQIALINNELQTWCQEDFVLGEQWFVPLFNPQFPLTPDSTKQDGQENKTQPISVGIDSGKLFSGIGVQSSGFNLWTAHLELPFKRVRERMDSRRLIQRGRRRRRINRKLPFPLRAYRQKRFSNRRNYKLAPSMIINLLRFLTLTTTVVNVSLFFPPPLNPCCVVNPAPDNISTLTKD
jgi:hypothetical protein